MADHLLRVGGRRIAVVLKLGALVTVVVDGDAGPKGEEGLVLGRREVAGP